MSHVQTLPESFEIADLDTDDEDEFRSPVHGMILGTSIGMTGWFLILWCIFG